MSSLEKELSAEKISVDVAKVGTKSRLSHRRSNKMHQTMGTNMDEVRKAIQQHTKILLNDPATCAAAVQPVSPLCKPTLTPELASFKSTVQPDIPKKKSVSLIKRYQLLMKEKRLKESATSQSSNLKRWKNEKKSVKLDMQRNVIQDHLTIKHAQIDSIQQQIIIQRDVYKLVDFQIEELQHKFNDYKVIRVVFKYKYKKY